MVRAQVPDDLGAGSNAVTAPCWAHVGVVEATSPPTDAKGKIIERGVVQIVIEVLAATDETQVGKRSTITFFNPKPGSDPKWPLKKHARMLLATGIIADENKGAEIEYDETSLVGRQLVVEFTHDTDQEGKQKTWCSVPFANFFHVDDPEVAKVPKNDGFLRDIPASLRKIGSKPKKEEIKFNPSSLKL